MADCFSIASLFSIYIRRSISAAGLSSQTIDIDNKTTIHFWGPNSIPNSPKPSLVLIHGFGPSGIFQWRKQIVSLSPHFDVYVPDLVFFGESTTKSNERSEAFQAECVGKMLERIGVDSYSLVGTSYGGFVAYHMGLMFPDRVQKVVIASSAVNMTRKDNEDFLKRADADKLEEVMLPVKASQLRRMMRLSVFKSLYMPDFFLNDVIHKFFAENRKEKLELLQGLTLGKSDVINLNPLQQVHIELEISLETNSLSFGIEEVLIIWGDNDQIFLPEKAYELEKMLGEKVKLQIIKNASHIPQIEQSDQFNNILKEFFHC